MSERYAFIAAEKATCNLDGTPRYQIRQMCGWLAVSVSGFYDWSSRVASATATRRIRLAAMIEHVFAEFEGRYGYRRIHAVLARRGYPCHPETVRAVMGQLGLIACQPRTSRRCTTRQAAQVADIPDLVGRDFSADTPGAKLVGDITYVPTAQGWLYVALVIDCYSRAIVGWAMADHSRTPLITAAIEMAARNITLPPGAIFHSDRGSNYTSEEYRLVLDRLGVKRSVGRTGSCYDNALAESTNGALKVELVNRVHYETRTEAAKAIAAYIEVFYNRRRHHSRLGYQTPWDVLNDFQHPSQAA